ncbi:response regulator [Candidatus Saccharibacteria bacterium]|jgi:DNA-binding response OmpR family regulator|nr:response regulator [Candidatus Saccharibacteria bacterium]MBP9132327.1 response regulator [Candidatus Saccharibacteria bacterium]
MAGSKTILCIEDDHFISEMYARALTNAGFNVLAVYSGEEALPIAKANNFNLIILDLWMHDKDGMQILRELRGSDGKGLANTKIIITTNYSEDEQSKEAMSAEADGYFVISELTPKKLVEIVRQLIGKPS